MGGDKLERNRVRNALTLVRALQCLLPRYFWSGGSREQVGGSRVYLDFGKMCRFEATFMKLPRHPLLPAELGGEPLVKTAVGKDSLDRDQLVADVDQVLGRPLHQAAILLAADTSR